MTRRAGWPVLLFLGACRFDPTLAPGTQITCTTAADCFDGSVCSGDGFCEAPVAGELGIEPGSVSVRYLRGTRAVSALPGAGTARVAFSTTRVPLPLPGLVTDDCLSCALQVGTGKDFSASCSLGPAAPSAGSCPLSVRLVDQTGGPAITLLAMLSIDQQAPAAPDTSVGHAVLHRAPQGDGLDPQPRSWLTLADGTVEPSTLLHVRVGSTVTFELNPLQTTADGGLASLSLGELDIAAAQLMSEDGAGNESAWVKVREIEWVAALGGLGITQPHRLDTYRTFSPALLRPDGVPAPEGAALSDAVTVEVSGGASWRGRQQLTGNLIAMAWDVPHQRMVVPLNVPGSVFEWAPDAWRQKLATDPEGDGYWSASFAFALASDPIHGVTAVHPGQATEELWRYTGHSWAKVPASGAPAGRPFAAAFWDDEAERIVLAGGEVDAGAGQPLRPTDETWGFADGGWSLLEAGSFPARSRAMAAYDTTRRVGFLLGGRGDDGGTLQDFWLWRDGHWSQADVPPPVLLPGNLAADEDRGVLTWFARPDGGTTPEIFEWSPDAGWAHRGTSSVTINPLLAAWSPADHLVLAAGGSRMSFWDGGVMVSRAYTNVGPMPASLAWYPIATAAIGWGGVTVKGNADGWLQYATGPVVTAWTRTGSLAWDVTRPALLWNGTCADGSGLWTASFHCTEPNAAFWLPFARTLWDAGSGPDDGGRACTFDGGGGYDGGVLGEAAAFVAGEAIAAGDAGLTRVAPGTSALSVLPVGGSSWLPAGTLPITGPRVSATSDGAQTWVSVGADLGGPALRVLRLDSVGPVAEGDDVPLVGPHVLLHSPMRQTLVLIGRDRPNDPFVEWELYGGRWLAMPTVDAEEDGDPIGPDARAIVDPTRNLTLVLASSMQWESNRAAARPQVTFTADLAGALIPGDARVLSLVSEWVVGGSGPAGPDGVHLAVWTRRGYLEPGAASSASTPAPLALEVTDEALLARVARDRGQVSVTAWPSAVNGTGAAVLRVDSVQVKLRFYLAP